MEFNRRKFFGMMTGGLAVTKLSGQEKTKETKTEISESINEEPKFVEDLRKIADDPEIPILWDKIKKKIDGLNPKGITPPIYGFVNSFVDINKKIKDTLARLKEQEQVIAKTKEQIRDEKDKTHGEYYLKIFEESRTRLLKRLKGFHRYAFPEKKENIKLEITGFEYLKGWSNERVRKVVNTLPQGLFANIEGIDFINEDAKNETFEIGAMAVDDPYFDPDAITWLGSEHKRINVFPVEYQDEEMTDTLIHEAAHHNDWEKSTKLNLKQRLEFLAEVLALYTSHLKSSQNYPDNKIYEEFKARTNKYKNQPAYALLLHQVTEYWAVLVEKYVNSKKQYKKSPEDYAQNVVGLTDSEEILVEKWMKIQGIDLDK